jgi:hypothetical protein
LVTAGIQDGDRQVSGSDTDIKLYLDNIEVPQAFDDVDQFDCKNGHWSDFVSSIEIEIPASVVQVFLDGRVEVRLVTLQMNKNCESVDAFAIDYCELEICTGDSTLP